MTGQMARPLLAYRCPTGFAAAEDVCRAFQKALGDAAPGHALRRVAKGEDAPELREGDLFLELHANQAGEQGLTGHVEWRRAGEDESTPGPVLRIDVMDAAPGPSTYDHFVQDLIRHGEVPLPGTARHAD